MGGLGDAKLYTRKGKKFFETVHTGAGVVVWCGVLCCGMVWRVSATRTRQEKLVWMEDSAKISLMEFHMVMAKMSQRH